MTREQTPQARYQQRKRAAMTLEQKEAERVRLSKYTKERNKKRYWADPEGWKRRTEEWRKANPEKSRRAHRVLHLRKAYGLTHEQYDRMVEEQGGLCSICREPPRSPKKFPQLHVDHDHKTGAVRGLLCQPCNQALGTYEKLVEGGLLERALGYLRGAR